MPPRLPTQAAQTDPTITTPFETDFFNPRQDGQIYHTKLKSSSTGPATAETPYRFHNLGLRSLSCSACIVFSSLPR